MTALLLGAAAVLGLLAFFEPCTIATHTLHTVRFAQSARKVCCQSLLAVWASRSLLLIGLFAAAVVLTPMPHWNAWTPSLALSVMAAVYILSRIIYIPVPHVAFHKILPAATRLPDAVQLGLTLPACTLPLVIIVAAIAATLNSLPMAIAAGLVFATAFTLPMVILSQKKQDDTRLDFLNRAARGSPWLTAVLLLLLALYLLIPTLEASADQLEKALTHPSWAGIGLAFLVGFVFSFNPVSFASIPVVIAYVAKAHEQRRALMMGGAFVGGIILTHVALGVAAALGGGWVQNIMGKYWNWLLGPLLIVLGAMWAGWLNIRIPWFGMKAKKATGLWGAFLLGIPFSVAICPFCTPALLVTLTASAAIGSVSFGFALLLAFALGRSIPIILGAWSMGWLESLKLLSRHQKLFETLAGITLIAVGLYLLNDSFSM